MLWRILKPLSGKTRLEAGTISALSMSEAHLQVLQERGAISPVAAPPLGVLPGWETRAQILAEHGILQADDFIEAQSPDLAVWLNDPVSKVDALKRDLLAVLAAPPPTVRF